MFDAPTYIQRREILKKKVASGIILLPGNDESSVNFSANWYHFRQDSTFLYYTGVNKPNLAAIINVENNEEILFGSNPTMDEIIWTGPLSNMEELANKAGITKWLPIHELKNYLQKNQAQKVHFLPPYRPEHRLKLQHWLDIQPDEPDRKKSVSLIKAIVEQRSLKTEEEVTLQEEAVNVTGQMHIEAIRAARPGMKEYELMSRVHQKALESGGKLAFPIILSKNGHILHNHSYGNTLKEGDIVLCDAGAEHLSGYAGDMTRTFPAGQKFTDTQKEVYTVVLKAQQTAVRALKPKALFKDVHFAACLKLTVGLKELGLMKGNEHDAVEAGAHTLFFQCGSGHMIGLDVHDMENLGEEYVGYTDSLKKSTAFGLKSLRLGRALEPGFVVAVEPGIYFIPELIDLWRKEQKYSSFINYDKVENFRSFGGIRIEDDFLITEDGARLLGNPVPKTIDEIEELRNQN